MGKGRSIVDPLLEEFAEWHFADKETREPKTQKEWAEQHGVTDLMKITRWKQHLEDKASLDEIEAFKKHLYTRAMDPKAPAKVLELYARMVGILKDDSKVEVNFEFSADQIAVANVKAGKQLKRDGFATMEIGRVEEVPEELPLLHSEVREDSGPR